MITQTRHCLQEMDCNTLAPAWTTCCTRGLGCCSPSCYDMASAGGRSGPPVGSRPDPPWFPRIRTRGIERGRGRINSSVPDRSPFPISVVRCTRSNSYKLFYAFLSLFNISFLNLLYCFCCVMRNRWDIIFI